MFWKGAAVKAVSADLAVVHGPVQQGYAIFGACLGEDIAHVVVHRSLADGESIGDLLIGQSFRNQFNDLDLSAGQGHVERVR